MNKLNNHSRINYSDKLFEICIYLFVISEFLENIVLIYTKQNVKFLYPFAFSFKYLILVLGVAPRIARLKFPFSSKVFLYTALFVYAIVISAQPFDRIATSVRDLTLFVFVFYILYAVKLTNRNQILKNVMRIILLMTFINIIYATYIVYTNDGTPANFYFYEYLVSIERWGDFNYFRNGAVRAFGLFASPITYSNFLILPLAYGIASLVVKPSFSKVLFLMVLIVGLFQTQTRNPPLAILMGVGIYFIWRIFKRFSWIIIFHLCVVTFSFYGLSFLYSIGFLEPSAAGRVIQAEQFLPTILKNWHGAGFGSFGAQFSDFSDLSLLTVFLTFGLIGGIVYYWFVFALLKKICTNYTRSVAKGEMNPYKKLYFVTIFITINSLVIVSINSNIFDSVVLPLVAVVTGLYFTSRRSQHQVGQKDPNFFTIVRYSQA